MNAEEVIKKEVNNCNIMQLATCANDKPWVVTVHFYADDELNLYWCSRPDRRHSEEVRANPNASATILVHENTEAENWVIGITYSGQVEELAALDNKLAQAYIDKLLKDPELPRKIASGEIPDKWYRLKPENIILFDTKNFPAGPRQELNLKS
jgi:nitroimidazol reductase NimA-like FMN-containing flavoprotein (pyridoxamine 5'-phosphate oxidase superfamily)